MSFLRRWSPSYLTCYQIKTTRYRLFIFTFMFAIVSAVTQHFLTEMYFCGFLFPSMLCLCVHWQT